MSKNNFVSHFLPFQINTTIFIFVNFFYKMAAGGHFGFPKITFGRISGHFRSIRNFYFNFYKMATSAHFGCPKFTFDRISGHFRSIHNFNFYLYFFCVNFVYKMPAGGHFGSPKITFGRISGHFRSIRIFFLFFFTKWLPSAILDVQNSLWITFLAIIDQYRFCIFCCYFLQNDFLDVRKSLSISFLAISDRYSTFLLLKFLTKWLPSAILDVRNSLWITIDLKWPEM